MITILGPTASGKTRLAARVAARISGEILSADSRQVYRGMDLGTGKDRGDYVVEGKTVPYHLIDIVDPGYEYNVYEYQRDFAAAYYDIVSRGMIPVLCGGTGMYLEAVLKGYELHHVPENQQLRSELEQMPHEDLVNQLSSYKPLHNVSDVSDRDRLVRAIEIQSFYRLHPQLSQPAVDPDPLIFGILFDRLVLRQRITDRLHDRLHKGMGQEVRQLLAAGLRPEQLTFYGLEYKFLTRYVLGELTYEQMAKLLTIAIHQFAKRQMTWFRRMERNGLRIHWIDGTIPEEEKVEIVLRKMNKVV
ncbi:MAG: tRNA (adenosine(37)-N6)-dimethylallyltransferase MiaA [Bacteroidales bacterium]|nr:tRNA (adenosine(37)-N6)-dimethylallyltransferase MiaA [Lentimicrobiaceae bacterium]MDD5695325.1 tRNA (adenosine(37)-N6)-dimethylallyltransferase MiaA [Bacteroidales bacterium]